MVLYSCPRCGYNVNNKSLYLRHLNRKLICKNIISNDDLQSEYTKYEIKNNINPSKITRNFEGYLNLPQNCTNVPQNNILQKEEYSCDYCYKIFSRKDNLNRHYKNCKEKKISEEADNSMNKLVNILNKQIEDQRKEFRLELEKKDREIEKRNKQIDELIKKSGIQNNNITTNIQNNIKLLAYQDTDISKISENDIISCINHNNMCIPHLIKLIHLDPKKPENHNIYISNIKNGYIMLYDGQKWKTYNRDGIILDMIDKKQTMIEEKIEDWITKGKEYPELMKKFERYLDKRENNEVLDKIKYEIKLMLYNNRQIVTQEKN